MAKNNKEHWIRIVKKEKDGPTLKFKLPNGETKIEKTIWKEFEKIYEIRDGEPYRGYIRKDYAEKAKKANDIYAQAMVNFMRASAIGEDPKDEKLLSEKMQCMYLMYEYIKDAAKVLGISEGESVKTFRDYMEISLNSLAGAGAVFMHGSFDSMLNEENLKKMKKAREEKTKTVEA